jgi:hypothetical protein
MLSNFGHPNLPHLANALQFEANLIPAALFMNISSWVATAAGAGLLAIVVLDIYRTILHSRAH